MASKTHIYQYFYQLNIFYYIVTPQKQTVNCCRVYSGKVTQYGTLRFFLKLQIKIKVKYILLYIYKIRLVKQFNSF